MEKKLKKKSIQNISKSPKLKSIPKVTYWKPSKSVTKERRKSSRLATSEGNELNEMLINQDINNINPDVTNTFALWRDSSINSVLDAGMSDLLGNIPLSGPSENQRGVSWNEIPVHNPSATGITDISSIELNPISQTDILPLSSLSSQNISDIFSGYAPHNISV